MRAVFLVLTALYIAGCSAAPLAGVRAASALGARVDTSTHAAIVKVPAGVFAFAEDHVAGLKEAHEQGQTTVHAGVTLVASRDGFKRDVRSIAIPARDVAATGTDRTVVLGMVGAGVAPGAYAYYLRVDATTVTRKADGLAIDELPVFYVSDYGKNYPVTIR